MSGRQFSVSFNITGALDGSLMAALKNAQNAMRGLGNSARAASAAAKASQAGLQGLSNSLNSIQNAAGKFKALQDALKQTTTDFGKSTTSLESARAKMQADAQAAEQLRQKLLQLNAELGKARTTKQNDQAGLKTLRQQMQELKRAFDLAKSLGNTAQMNQLASQMAILGTTLQAQQAKVKAAAQAYKELSDKVKQAKVDLKAADTAASQSGKSYNEARNNAQKLSQSWQQQLSALNQLKASLSAAGFNVSHLSAEESRLQSEINRVNAALQQQQALLNAQRASSQASQEMFNAYNNFQGALQTAQTIAQPFKSAVDNAMTFEHAMSRVKALTQSQNIREGKMDVVDADMKLLTQQARDLGATTMFTATQATEAMGYLGMAGWKTQQIYGTMPGMLDLAAAAGADLAQTADIVSDNMTAMGVAVKDAPHFMDVYAYALTNSNARLTDFGETMKYAAPVAKAYGATLDETAAMVMMMANAGIKGSMAGTSLRMGLLRLAGPPKTATKEMEKLGLSLSDAQAGALEAEAVIKGLGIDLTGATTAGDKMTRVLMQLHDKTKDLSQDEKLAAFKGIFGVNAETGWLALFDQGPEVFLKYLEGLKNADGYASQVAKTMNDDTRGALIILESALDALQERVGESLLPTVKSAAEAFTPMVTAAAQWIEANPAVVQGAAAIAAALAGIIVSAAAVKLAFAGWSFIATQFGLLAQAASAFRLGMAGFAAETGGILGAINLLGLRIAALRTAFAGLATYATIGGWSAMFSKIAAQAALAGNAIRTFFASLTLGSVASKAVAAISGIGTAIRGAAVAAMSFAFSPVGVALMALALAGLYCYQNWEKVAPVLSNIAGIITGSLSGALQTIAPAIQGVMSAFENLGNALGASGLLSNLGMLVTGALATIATAIAGTLATVINVAATIVSTIANVISGIVNTITAVVNGDIPAAFEAMKSIATSAFEGIANVAKGILDGILSTVKAIGDAWDFLRGKTPSGAEKGGGGGDFAAPKETQAPAPIQIPAPEVSAPTIPTPEAPALDTTATQSALDAVGSSAQNAATNMDGVNQATQNIAQAGDAFNQIPQQVQPAAEAFSQVPPAVQPAADVFANLPSAIQPAQDAFANLPTAIQPAADGLQQMGTTLPQVTSEAQNLSTAMQADATSAQAHTAALDANSAALNANIGALQAFGAACEGAIGGVTALGSAASSAAGSVSGLGAAAQSACAQLAAAGANAAAQVSAAASSISVKANAEGGIYRKGAFLTTFAEESPEAAIPLDNSERAKSLWTTVGQMLGLLPGKPRDHIQEALNPYRVMHTTAAKEILSQESPLPTSVGLPQPAKQYPLPKLPKLPNQRRGRNYQGDRPLESRIKFPFNLGDEMPKVRRLPRGLNLPSLIGKLPPMMTSTFPQMTPLTFPQIESPQETSGGIFGRLAENLFGNNRAEEPAMPPINITLNLTINGQADAGEVQRGVESAAPILQRSLASELRDYRREQLRRSYA